MRSRTRSLAMTALSGLLAGLPVACASQPAVTEVVMTPTIPPSGETTSNTTSTDTQSESQSESDSQQAAVDPGAPDETTAPVKPRRKPKKRKPATAVVDPNVASPKSCCAGLNACKGLGGCKTALNGCMGKNDCKGKGGCKMGNCSP